MAAGDIKSQDAYIQKTAKLIPAEALALYLTISGQVKAATGVSVEDQRYITLTVAVFICLVIVPFVLYKLQHVRSRGNLMACAVEFSQGRGLLRG